MGEYPFKQGDRIHEIRANELDPTKPDATVIDVTKVGFRYRYDVYPLGAPIGCRSQEGECGWDEVGGWTKI